MKVELYPEFNEVFESEILKGIFYPLCKISEINSSIKESFFFVSNNGIWTDEKIKNENNQSDFTCFINKNGKYHFNGNLDLYIGYHQATEIFKILETDFKLNGKDYLSERIKTDSYIQTIYENFNFDYGELDSEYYLGTFYEFSINKLNFEKTGDFGRFRQLIDGWRKPDKSPVVYEIKDDNSTGYADIQINKEFLSPKTFEIEKYDKIGYIVGSEFFTDGNDTYLLFDRQNEKIVSINHYS